MSKYSIIFIADHFEEKFSGAQIETTSLTARGTESGMAIDWRRMGGETTTWLLSEP